MSNLTTLTRALKTNTKRFGFWRKVSTATWLKSISRNILYYRGDAGKAEAIKGGKSMGRVRAFGFLRDDITRMTGQYPYRLENNALVDACHSAWMQRAGTKYSRKFGHKFKLSLDPKFCELMTAWGKDCDAVLVQTARTVLRQFQQNYYPGDRLGYLLGIHHGGQHVEAHVLLYPYTEKGRHLRVTDSTRDLRSRISTKLADKLVRDHFIHESEYPIMASERPADRITQIRLIGLYVQAAFTKTGQPSESQGPWIVAEQTRVLALPDLELRPILIRAYERELERQQKFLETLQGNQSKAQDFLQSIAKRQAGYKFGIQRGHMRTKDLSERLSKLQAKFHEAYRDLANFRFCNVGAKGCGLGVVEMAAPNQREWLLNALIGSKDANDLRTTLKERNLCRTALAGQPEWIATTIDEMIREGLFERIATRENVQGKQHPNQPVRSSQDFMRLLFLRRLDGLKGEQEKLEKEIEINRTELDTLRLQLESLRLIDLETQAAVKGRKPQFLEQFEGIRRAGMDLPITCRSMEDQLVERLAEVEDRFVEDSNPRIIETLRAFKGDRSREAIQEVDKCFKAIVGAVVAPRPPRNERSPAMRSQDEAFRLRLHDPGTREFLVAPQVRLPGTSEEKLQATMACQIADSEFEL